MKTGSILALAALAIVGGAAGGAGAVEAPKASGPDAAYDPCRERGGYGGGQTSGFFAPPGLRTGRGRRK